MRPCSRPVPSAVLTALEALPNTEGEESVAHLLQAGAFRGFDSLGGLDVALVRLVAAVKRLHVDTLDREVIPDALEPVGAHVVDLDGMRIVQLVRWL